MRQRTGGSLLLALVCLTLAGCSSSPSSVSAPPATPTLNRAGNAPFYKVNGKQYRVLVDATGYHERGVASWYGRKFHGRPTASGEIYDMHALTAAHKSLPIPSYVRVRNLANGRTIVVRVNDRGPFVKNRLIDLSYEAARRLDLIGPGTGLVDVQVISDPNGASATLAKAAVNTTPSTTAGGYQQFFVQVGAFSEARNAQAMRARLETLGFSNVVIHRGEPSEPAYRVRVGPFADVAAYDRIVAKMRTVNITDTFLTGY